MAFAQLTGGGCVDFARRKVGPVPKRSQLLLVFETSRWNTAPTPPHECVFVILVEIVAPLCEPVNTRPDRWAAYFIIVFLRIPRQPELEDRRRFG